jgi:hypothetical protein
LKIWMTFNGADKRKLLIFHLCLVWSSWGLWWRASAYFSFVIFKMDF